MRNREERRSTVNAFFQLALMLALAIPLIAQQRERDGAKAIFYQSPASQTPEGDKILVTKKQSATAQTPALRYWLELEGAGKVNEDRVFHTGDRLKLHVSSNIDGRLTLWACDASGQSQLLFPAPTTPTGSNAIRANTDFMLGVIELSPPAADERLLLFFSESGDNIPSPQQAALTAEQIKQAMSGSPGLLVEVEAKDSATFGTYLANRQGGVLAREIRLK
ncbi:MAG TPA: DUF4384 domain-containing protein, partial [Blastocatellia bacterium]|nr:DUF4384 domain-containing protein [Blastocatellia bacterium]